MAGAVRAREQAHAQGSAKAQLQHPVIDLSLCVGCGACVDVCPEDGVLAMVHGQAQVVNGSRCVGVAACERACPTAAITVTLGNLAHRDDVPAVRDDLEAVGQPGLFLAGEVTAHALIKTAIEHGTRVARAVSKRVQTAPRPVLVAAHPTTEADDMLDLLIVGAGPAGLACALEATRLGVNYALLDQADTLGGTVAKYPRRKLVLTQPVDLPLRGRMARDTYSKEDLMALWQEVAQAHALRLHTGREVGHVVRDADGTFTVHTQHEPWRARHVCLALGRRGTPDKLGVEGEDLAKVAYGLIDAQSYRGRRVLVVGGGDSAVETALALAEQSGTQVTLSYRKDSFFRVRARNTARLDAATQAGRVRVLFASQVERITKTTVELAVREPGQSQPRRLTLPNDDVFVLVGGKPPFALLERAGVSFDPAHHPPTRQPTTQGTGWRRATLAGLVIALATLAFVLWHFDYYRLALPLRPTHDKHALLRPGRNLGLALGIAAVALVTVNLLYLLRRAGRLGLTFGSLRTWMTSHVATGVLALSCAFTHAALTPRDTPGGHAFWALVLLVITGAIGRYFYAYVPRAANGRELELVEVKQQLERSTQDWDGTARAFATTARSEIDATIAHRQWNGTLLGRVWGLLAGERDRRRMLARLRCAAQAQGVPRDKVVSALALAGRAHRASLAAAHFEDLRGLLSTWRFLHRWVAALLVLLIVVHVVNALRYGQMWESGA